MRKSCTVSVNGQIFLANRGDLLLDAALANGVELPHDCRAGQCGTCKLRILDGITYGGESDDGGMVKACQARVITDLDVLVESVPDVVTTRGIVTGLRPLAPDVLEVRISLAKPVEYLPGQYYKFQFRGFPTRCFSPTAAMTKETDDGGIRLHVRQMPGGRVSSALGAQIGIGHPVRLEGPFGTAYLRPNLPNRLVLIGSSTGFAPIWSIAEAALIENPTRKIVMITASKTFESLYMGPAARRVSNHPGVIIIPVASEVPRGVSDAVRRGRPTDHMPKLRADDIVYACGAQAMVDAVKVKANEAGATFYADPFVAQTDETYEGILAWALDLLYHFGSPVPRLLLEKPKTQDRPAGEAEVPRARSRPARSAGDEQAAPPPRSRARPVRDAGAEENAPHRSLAQAILDNAFVDEREPPRAAARPSRQDEHAEAPSWSRGPRDADDDAESAAPGLPPRAARFVESEEDNAMPPALARPGRYRDDEDGALPARPQLPPVRLVVENDRPPLQFRHARHDAEDEAVLSQARRDVGNEGALPLPQARHDVEDGAALPLPQAQDDVEDEVALPEARHDAEDDDDLLPPQARPDARDDDVLPPHANPAWNFGEGDDDAPSTPQAPPALNWLEPEYTQQSLLAQFAPRAAAAAADDDDAPSTPQAPPALNWLEPEYAQQPLPAQPAPRAAADDDAPSTPQAPPALNWLEPEYAQQPPQAQFAPSAAADDDAPSTPQARPAPNWLEPEYARPPMHAQFAPSAAVDDDALATPQAFPAATVPRPNGQPAHFAFGPYGDQRQVQPAAAYEAAPPPRQQQDWPARPAAAYEDAPPRQQQAWPARPAGAYEDAPPRQQQGWPERPAAAYEDAPPPRQLQGWPAHPAAAYEDAPPRQQQGWPAHPAAAYEDAPPRQQHARPARPAAGYEDAPPHHQHARPARPAPAHAGAPQQRQQVWSARHGGQNEPAPPCAPSRPPRYSDDEEPRLRQQHRPARHMPEEHAQRWPEARPAGYFTDDDHLRPPEPPRARPHRHADDEQPRQASARPPRYVEEDRQPRPPQPTRDAAPNRYAPPRPRSR